MLTDEQFGQRLGAALRHEVDGVHAAPDLLRTLRRTLRRRRARRTWAVRTVIATPVAAAAATVLVVTTTSGPDTPGSVATGGAPATSSAPVRVQTVAYVKEQTLQALSQAARYVLYAKTTYRSGHYDTWIDKATQRYRNDVYTSNPPPTQGRAADGKMTAPGDQPTYPIHLSQSHAVSGPNGNQDIVTVDYDIHKWFIDHDSHKNPPPDIPDITDADAVREAITDGKLELVGDEKVDGIDTLQLRLYGPKREYRIDMWVDGKTYLPVREMAVKSQGGRDEFPDSAAEITNYTWLPRTPENLAKLTLTPPPDFQRIK